MAATAPGPRAIAWAAGFQLCFVAGVALLKASSNALLIARGSAAWLPVLYVLSALATGLFAMLLPRLTRRKPAPPSPSLAAAALLFAGFPLTGLAGTAGLCALYVAVEVTATIASLRYWEAMGRAFDAREARRVFTLLGASGMAGSILGGSLCPLFARGRTAAALLPAGAAFLVGAALFGAIFARDRGGAPERAPGPARASSRPLALLRDDRYVRGLALSALLLAALTAVVDYLFRRRAGALLGEAGLASLFGEMSVVVGVLAVLFQLGPARSLLAHAGIFRYLAGPPFGVAAAAATSAFLPGLAPIFVAKAVENAGSLSITQSGFQLLYGPVAAELQAPVRGLVDGFMKKAGSAAGGLLLLLLGTRCPDPLLAGAAALLAAITALALLRQKPGYVEALARRLASVHLLRAGDLAPDARQLLRAELSSPEPRRVLNALTLLSAERGFDPRPFLGALLDHSSERVREAAARLCASRGAPLHAPRLLAMAEGDPARRPRDEAVRALATLLPADDALARLGRWAESDDPGLRAAAVESLWGLGEPGRRIGRRGLDRALAGVSVPERREAARLLGRLGGEATAARLRRFLSDRDPSVRALACASAARARLPELMDPLFALLESRETRRAAREALAAYGDEAVGPAWARLDDRSLPLPLRLELPRLLRYIGTAEAANALLHSNIQDDAFLRWRIGLALSRWREQNPDIPIDERRVGEAIGRRIDAYLHYLPIWADVRAAIGERALLTRALADRLDQSLEVVFRLLGLIHPRRTLLSAHRRFTGEDARERAQAVELLDSLLPGELRARLVPLLEAYHRHPARPAAADPRRLDERLAELAAGKDTMIQMLSRSVIRERRPEMEEVSQSDESLERILLLEGVDIFAGCSVDDLSALAAIAREARFSPGEPIYREGEPGETLYVIIDGRVRIDKAGREMMVLSAREAFGSVSLVDGAPRPADATAATEVHCLALDRGDFLDLVADRPELLKGVFSVVTGQFRRMLDQVAATRATAA